ncbi:hypothetical protein AB0M44_27585 [Streptosporangium subroseum]|uniref:hypothetical protein n=1 Tax=Streptosporangium subroseum TaxID=106412 RepID=UPI003417B5E9
MVTIYVIADLAKRSNFTPSDGWIPTKIGLILDLPRAWTTLPGDRFCRAIIGFGDPSGVDHAVGATEGLSSSTGGVPVERFSASTGGVPVEEVLLVGGGGLPPVLGT